MKKIIAWGVISLVLSACCNNPGGNTCTDSYANAGVQSPAPASVPAPPSAPYGWCPCTAPNQPQQQTPQPPVTQPQPPAQQPVQVVYVPVPSTAESSGTCSIQSANKSEPKCTPYRPTCPPNYPKCPYHDNSNCSCSLGQQNITHVASPTDQCRFDSMPITPQMSPTEILNRTR